MGYLRLYDYASNIQSTTFNQLIQNNDSLRVIKEQVSKALIISYIVQKFNTDEEFTDTTIFSPSTIYQGQSLVELNYPAWAAASYLVGQMVTYTDGKCYLCTTNASSIDLPTNAAFWQLLGTKFDLFYIPAPYQEFNVYGFYKVGNIVFWKNKVYKCLIQTNIPDHISQLQDATYDNIPLNNVFPDQPVNGVKYWGSGVDYSVTGLIINAALPAAWAPGTYTAGTRKTYLGKIWQSIQNTSAIPGEDIVNWQPEGWKFGDNRNAQLVECMIWITIDKLAPLISPVNTPKFWDKKYDQMLVWLQMVADGHVTLDAPIKQPSQGAKIRFGGNIKQYNGY